MYSNRTICKPNLAGAQDFADEPLRRNPLILNLTSFHRGYIIRAGVAFAFFRRLHTTGFVRDHRNRRMTTPAILVVTGASGSGKTTAVRALEARALPRVRCHYSDDMLPVPSMEEMRRDFVSPEQCQAFRTQQCLDQLATVADGTEVCVLDCQTRPSFVRVAAKRAHIAIARVVLLDAPADVRHERLAGSRGQPALCNPQMDSWAAYLRGQADALNLPVIDTTGVGIAAVVDALVACVEKVRSER